MLQGVVLVSDEPGTKAAVKSALESNDRFGAESICPLLEDLPVLLEREPTGVVVVDLDPDPLRVLADLEPIISRFGEARFVLLSESQSSDLLLEAMQIGARHLMVKSSIAQELAGVVKRLAGSGAEGKVFGRAVTVLSASGGCGATTLAVNLGYELHLVKSVPVLLIDMDCCYGAVASSLGLKSQFGLADVLDYTGEIDTELVSSTARYYSEGVAALISPVSTHPVDPPALRLERLEPAIEVCRLAYRYTVIDAPRVSMELAGRLASISHMTYLVLQPNVKDVRVARTMISALGDQGVAMDRVVPVLNRYQKRGLTITVEEINKALGGGAIECLSNEYRNVAQSLNVGKPLELTAPRSRLVKDFRRLAEGL